MADQYPLARKGGLLGPTIERSLQLIHARELAKETMGSFKRGGKVRRTGLYKLHKGERVIPAHKSHSTLDLL
jgi:hypothetical protein